MENKTESQLLSDEISLLDLWKIIYESKFFIVLVADRETTKKKAQ